MTKRGRKPDPRRPKIEEHFLKGRDAAQIISFGYTKSLVYRVRNDMIKAGRLAA